MKTCSNFPHKQSVYSSSHFLCKVYNKSVRILKKNRKLSNEIRKKFGQASKIRLLLEIGSEVLAVKAERKHIVAYFPLPDKRKLQRPKALRDGIISLEMTK